MGGVEGDLTYIFPALGRVRSKEQEAPGGPDEVRIRLFWNFIGKRREQSLDQCQVGPAGTGSRESKAVPVD